MNIDLGKFKRYWYELEDGTKVDEVPKDYKGYVSYWSAFPCEFTEHKDNENNCGGCAGCVECKLEDAYYKAIEIVKQQIK